MFWIQLSHWLTHEGPASLKKLEIADSLGRAEMLCNHFETGVASLAEVSTTPLCSTDVEDFFFFFLKKHAILVIQIGKKFLSYS